MHNLRRQFLKSAGAAVAAFLAACRKPAPNAGATPAGTPPTLGTAPEVGPVVSTSTFAEAEKLMQFPLSSSERETAAGNWRKTMAPLYERRVGPRKFSPPPSVAPASQWNPTLPGQPAGPTRDVFIRTANVQTPLPASDQAIAFTPVSQLSRWIETRQLTSQRLTHIYLDRIRQFDSRLRSVITLTADVALTQAEKTDREIAAGHYRGPLHGIPLGCQRPAGYSRDRYHLWGRTLSQSNSHAGRPRWWPVFMRQEPYYWRN